MKKMWGIQWKRCVARILAAALTVTTCMQGAVFTSYAESYGKHGVVRDLTSWQIVDDMGLGYNIGNTFDSIGSWISVTDPWEYQRAWNNDPVNPAFIRKIREAGFKSIRLPVSWAYWIDENNQVNPGYMSAVQTVVDWCLAEDMYVILNVHHDSGAADNSWVRNVATDFEGTSKKYADLWTQIAGNFADYGDHLIFEGMNEVEFPAAPNMSRQYELLNHMNQLFVDTVRATGGNNAKRHLLIPGYNTDIRKTSDRRYRMPEDPAGHCILSIHYYSPSPFCVAEHDVDWAVPATTWGSEEDMAQVRADLDILKENFLGRGVPVIIGEYGVLTEDNKEKESIRAYLKNVPEIIMEYGMCPVLWDTSNAGDMKFVERNTGEFYDPQIRANYLELAAKKANGQIRKADTSVTKYQEVQLPISPGGWVSLASYEPSKVLGVRFTLTCSSDWDSYGGGGIWIDGYENTPQYQFNSVFDEVTYLFTAEERARLGDRLGIFLWWTDESKGGNRVSDLSFENARVTLLYEEEANVSKAGPYTGTGTASGGGGGGGGGGHSSRPNTGTTPGESGNNPGSTVKDFQYIMREHIGEEENPNGKRQFQIRELCPDYEPGDTVRFTVQMLSDGGYSCALSTTLNGFTSSDSWGPDAGQEQTWETTPGEDGTVTMNLWYLGGSYLMFNLKAEVTKKPARFPEFVVKQGETVDYDLSKLMAEMEIRPGSRIKVTVSAESADGSDYSGEVVMTDQNGVTLSAAISGDVSPSVVAGTPKDGKTIRLGASEGEVRIRRITVEALAESGALAEFQGVTRAEIPLEQIQKQEAAEGEETGLKVYYDAAGQNPGTGSSYQLVVNNAWDHGQNDTWILKEDRDGKYIWYPCQSVSSLLAACWYLDGEPFKILKVVQMTAAQSGEEPGTDEDRIVRSGTTEVFDLSDILAQQNIPDGSRIKVTVLAEAADSSGSGIGGEVVLHDVNGVTISLAFSAGNIVTGTPEGNQLEVNVGSDEADIRVTRITVESVEASPYLAELGSGGSGRIELTGPALDQAEKETAGERQQTGLKLYYEYDGDIREVSGNLVVNNDWGYGNDQWECGQDARGTYLFYPCQSVNSVLFAVWYTGNPVGVAGMTIVEPDAAIPVDPDTPEEPGDYATEVIVEPDTDGKYYIPEGREDFPAGFRCRAQFTNDAQNSWGENATYSDENGNWAGTGWVGYSQGTSYVWFGDDQSEFSYLTFGNGITSAAEVTFLYWEKAEGLKDVSSSDNIFALPDRRVPSALVLGSQGGNTSIVTRSQSGGTWTDGDYVSWLGGGTYDDTTAMEKLEMAIQTAGADGNAGLKFSDDPGTVTFYYPAGQEEIAPTALPRTMARASAQELQEYGAEELDTNMFRLPVLNTPAGIRYELEEEGNDGSGNGTLHVGTIGQWENLDRDETMTTAVTTATASDWQEEDKGQEGENRKAASVATSSDWQAADTAASAARKWDQAAGRIPGAPDSEKTYIFTPQELKAIAKKIESADKEEDWPVFSFDWKKLGYRIRRLFLLYDPEEILNEDMDIEDDLE